MRELLAANKIVIMALFATEIPSYYNELPEKMGGENPSVQSKATCWALVTKLMRTIFKEVHQVRRFASEAVLLGADSLQANGMFFYAQVGSAVWALSRLRQLHQSARPCHFKPLGTRFMGPHSSGAWRTVGHPYFGHGIAGGTHLRGHF
jgi:hypothetical protein